MKHFQKFTWIFLVILTLFVLCNAAFAQEAEESEENLALQFTKLKYRNQFYQITDRDYYRFPFKTPLFDPLDQKYFPHESWWESDWALLSRYEDSYTYKQLIMLREPMENSFVYNGTAIGADYGFLDDFYLYATMFVSDSYPDNLGACYIYYSNSLITGFEPSRGIMIEPDSGIYSFNNYYGKPYNLTNKYHELNIVTYLSPDDYQIDETDIASSTFAAKDFLGDQIDDQFVQDWISVIDGFHVSGSTVRAYRIELIREGTNLRVYINGTLAAELDDEILETHETDEESITVPSKVSWSYGPMLRNNGITVTCSVGDLYIYGRPTTRRN